MKRDLYFNKPLMNAAGSLGFAPDPHTEIPCGPFGAFVTNPISLRPRLPAAQAAVAAFPGGFLLHSGLPNPGLKAVIKSCKARWRRAALPILVHLMADRPEETLRMVEMLEGLENVMAVELGFAPRLPDDIVRMNLEMCRGELPLIIALPVEQILTLGPRLVDEGAAALSISAPRGTIRSIDGHLISGRMYGPSLFPRSLEIVRSAALVGLPIIGCGGIWNDSNAEDMLAAGAIAVQFDATLWIPRDAPA